MARIPSSTMKATTLTRIALAFTSLLIIRVLSSSPFEIWLPLLKESTNSLASIVTVKSLEE